MNFLEIPIEKLPGTSAITLRRLKFLGIKTYWDILNYFPFRYENYSLISPICELQEGEKVTVKGQVLDIKNEYTKRGFNLQKAILYDQAGKIDLIWYNQPYLVRVIRPGSYLSISGQVKKYLYSYVIQPEEYEILESIDDETIHTGKIVPVYPEKRGLSSKTIREKVFYVLRNVETIHELSLPKLEFLPPEIISYNNLMDEWSAYQNIHFPTDFKIAKQARERLAFDEIFTIQLSSKLIKREWQKEIVGHKFNVDNAYIRSLQQFINRLPFQLTKAQRRCLGEILDDLKKPQPMNRLLQGDVGSGKTVVAAIAAYLAYLNSFNTLFMAPTEILAQQHYKTLINLFNMPSLLDRTKMVNVCLYTSSSKPKKQDLEKARIVVGTHALITKKAIFNKVGLVVIDEQHKFGVVQRAMLKQKGLNPHLLTMTATPIPRTVVLALYGELDLSVIDEMPPGRIITKTFFVPKEKRSDGYLWIKKQIKSQKTQAFIICPLIEESEIETMQSVKAAKKEFDYLKDKIFNDFNLGLLHGKMKSKEKEEVMSKFAKGQIDILVSTPVVEVGIDVPNATIILIEAAERFGMAQLHQLRGRVGRSSKQAYCFLFTDVRNGRDRSLLINKRLKIFAKTTDGFVLAEYDLKLRGAGEIYGTKQHGVSNLKIASLSDSYLIEKSQRASDYFFNRYKITNFPLLQKIIENYRITVISRD